MAFFCNSFSFFLECYFKCGFKKKRGGGGVPLSFHKIDLNPQLCMRLDRLSYSW